MRSEADKRMTIVIVAALVALIVFQVIAASIYPAAGIAPTGRSVGRASFAYLGGLRTFAAAVLWNRLDSPSHDYYGGKPLEKQTWMLPTMRLVQMLDPQFVQSYYVAAWVVARQDMPDALERGLAVAREGVENNPTSGLMRLNFAQILQYVGNQRGDAKLLSQAADQARIGMAEDIAWMTPEEEFEAYAVFRGVLKQSGDTAGAARAEKHLDYLASQGVSVQGGDGHDHDGDGTADH